MWAAVAVALPYRPYFRETGSTGVRYSYRKLRLLTRTYLGTTLYYNAIKILLQTETADPIAYIYGFIAYCYTGIRMYIVTLDCNM